MNRVDRTDRARVDLLQVWNYIAERNFPAADRTLDRIPETLNLIATQPERGEAVEHMKADVRRFSVGNDVLYFEPAECGVRLLRVVHGAREVPDLTEFL